MEEYLEIGQIVTTTGLKGAVKVNPFTDNIQRFKALKKVYVCIKNELTEFFIEEVKFVKNSVVLKLKGIDTIEEAEKYRNCYIKIERKDAVKLPKNSYFIVDLLGSKVYDEQNEYLGVLEDIFPTGSNDVYVVRNDLGKQILLPAIASVIKQIDVENKKVIVNLIEGLI